MSDFKHIVAIIPARQGSKGIPKKNISIVGGKPLLAWTLEQCRATPSLQGIYVSTDGKDIAAVAGRCGAEIIERPPEISGDAAGSEDALLHALDVIEQRRQKPVDLVVFLQATAPLRYSWDIEKAIELLRADRADSLLSCTIPAHVCLWQKEGGHLTSMTYDYLNRKPRQMEKKHYLENGSIYVMTSRQLRQSRNRLGGKIVVYLMQDWQSYQIDEPQDIKIVELFLPRTLAKEPVGPLEKGASA